MDNPFEAIDKRLTRLEEKSQSLTEVTPETVLSKTGAKELLGVTLNTLSKYTRDGTIPAYGIGSRVLYKRSELLDSLIRINKTRP